MLRPWACARIVTNKKYMHHEFKLQLSTLFKAYEVKYTENSKNITFQNNIRLHSVQLCIAYRSIRHNRLFFNFSDRTNRIFGLCYTELIRIWETPKIVSDKS